MKPIKNLQKKKPAPFYAIGSTIPITQEELNKRKTRYRRLMAMGINPMLIVDTENADEHENPYRVEVMLLINQDKEVPQELVEKMQQYDKEYMIRCKATVK